MAERSNFRHAAGGHAIWRLVGFDRIFRADRLGRAVREPRVLPARKGSVATMEAKAAGCDNRMN